MDGFSSASSQLKMALMRKLRFFFLSLKLYKLRLDNKRPNNVTMRRTRSFNAGRRKGLCGCFNDDDDDDDDESFGMIKRLHRTRSSIYARDRDCDDCDDRGYDVDQRAEIFISNFRSRLLMEREVSLKLRYCEKD